MTARSWAAFAVALSISSLPSLAFTAVADPAAAQIEGFYAELSGVLRAEPVTASKLKPTVERTFNLPVMAQFSVGPQWSAMPASDKVAVIAALTRYTAARYAKDLTAAHGVTFVVDPAVQVRGDDRLVKSEARAAGQAPTKLYYRLRQYSGVWRVVDVLQDGVSEIATQRADFSAALAKGGAANLVRKLDEATAKLK